MLFALINTDRPGALELRMATRPAHLAFMAEQAAKIVSAGALLDAEGRPAGTLALLELPDRAAAEAFAAADPYAKAGLFESSVLRPFRPVYRDGVKVA